MSIAYGIEVTDHEDRYIAIAERALEGLSEAAVPGAYMVDQIPLCKKLIPFLSVSLTKQTQ